MAQEEAFAEADKTYKTRTLVRLPRRSLLYVGLSFACTLLRVFFVFLPFFVFFLGAGFWNFRGPGAVKQEKTSRNTETNSKINFIFGGFPCVKTVLARGAFRFRYYFQPLSGAPSPKSHGGALVLVKRGGPNERERERSDRRSD